jgi:hypothetical protein
MKGSYVPHRRLSSEYLMRVRVASSNPQLFPLFFVGDLCIIVILVIVRDGGRTLFDAQVIPMMLLLVHHLVPVDQLFHVKNS